MSSIGALLGAPARASMVTALFDGRAHRFRACEGVGVSSSTASEHLEKLRAGRLVVCERFGRFRYYKLAGSEVAELLEPLVHLVGKRPVPFGGPPGQPPSCRMRACVTTILPAGWAHADRSHARPRPDGRRGSRLCSDIRWRSFLRRHRGPARSRSSAAANFARQCLDWSERRPHLAGSLGAALAELALLAGWIEREPNGRRVFITARGGKAFFAHSASRIELFTSYDGPATRRWIRLLNPGLAALPGACRPRIARNAQEPKLMSFTPREQRPAVSTRSRARVTSTPKVWAEGCKPSLLPQCIVYNFLVPEVRDS